MTLGTAFMSKAQLPDVSGESSKSSDGSSPAVLISSLTLSTCKSNKIFQVFEIFIIMFRNEKEIKLN